MQKIITKNKKTPMGGSNQKSNDNKYTSKFVRCIHRSKNL